MVLIVNYALRNQGKDYAPFFNGIKTNCLEWWHFLDSTFIVVTPKSPDEFARSLFPYMEKTDSLIVARLQKDYQGWLPPAAWEWLNNKYY